MSRKPTREELEQKIKALETRMLEYGRMETALRDSEEKYRLLFENADILISVYDENGVCLLMNQVVADQFGGVPSDFIGKSFHELHPGAADEYVRRIQDAIDTESAREFEDLVCFPEGERWLLSNVQPVRAADGKVTAAQIISRDITKLKKTEKELQESRGKFRAIFDQAFQFIGLMATDGRLLEANRSALEFGGLTAKDVIGKPFWQTSWWTHSADQQERLKTAIKNAAIGKLDRFEAFHPMPDGTIQYVDVSIKPIENENGDIIFLGAEGRDITDRKRSEEARLHFFKSMEMIDRVIRREIDIEIMLGKVIDRVFSIFQSDRAWLLYPCDPGARAVEIPIERTRPEYPGALAMDMKVPMTPFIARDLRKALDTDGPIDYGPESESPVLSDSLTSFSVKSQIIMAIYPKAGKPWLFGLHQCAYARKWTDDEKELFKGIGRRISDGLGNMILFKELKESEEKLRTITTSARDAIIMIDHKGDVTFWNKAAETIFGYSDREILGRELHTIIMPSDSHAGYREAFTSFISTGQGPVVDKTMETTGITKNGTEIAIELSITSARMKGEWHAIGIIRDITERKTAEAEKIKLEAELHKARRLEAVGTLAGGIAHDFNNLLMGIQGRTSLMLMDQDPGTPDYEHLKGIEDHVQSAAELTRRLLGFSRGGKYEVKPSDLNLLVKKSADMFGRTRKDIEIITDYQNRIWTVMIDRVQIEQVLLNLYVNAGQSMPNGGKIYLKTENNIMDSDRAGKIMISPGRYVKIEVADIGTGMDKQTRERIFEPFFTTRDMGRGTGLGLASAYGIVRNHGGMIIVDSEKGKGAKFEIFLPASEKKIIGETLVENAICPGAGTILIVDDEDMVLDVGKQMVQKLGYDVIATRNGKEALRIYEAKQDGIDLVILDLVMPEISGSETFYRLRQINGDVKVLLSSGYSINGQARQLLEQGCSGFIQKPFGLNELSQKIKDIIL